MGERRAPVFRMDGDSYLISSSPNPFCNLMASILARAILDIQGKNKLEAERARDWFLSQEEDYPFSFLSICGFLGMCPVHIKKKLMELGEFDAFINTRAVKLSPYNRTNNHSKKNKLIKRMILRRNT